MAITNIKEDLISIAEHISPQASYTDVMYELYVRMKIVKGKQAADEGRVMSHEDVKKRFL
ncbi:hypothetical protein MNBD_UNCLBAC01-484 [hydrothermal vent metagenome]|uniref:Uncharacterized protein n=1 Tax=hydrothermal vent metagenome TaxID=652676 RepID=A0A3B1D6X4_9ZZZZ